MIRLVAVALAALTLGACAAMPSGPVDAPLAASRGAPTFAATACPAEFAATGRAIECGTLTVDEARDGTSDRRIDIAVAIVRASAPFRDASGRTLPPVVWFHGGPGGDSVASVPGYLRLTDLVAVDQDWIFFDQRGSGLSKPSMECPGTNLTDAGPPSAADAAAISACLKGFADQGVDLSQYNARAIAADVQDLRRALNLDQIDLFGGSYGPRIEAALLTHAPQGVRAVVMDSPWPPEGNWAMGTPEQVSAAVRTILGKCAAQADCAGRHPDLQARFEAKARQWLAAPQSAGGRTWTVEDLASFLMDTTYSNRGVRSLPADLEKIIAGDLSPIAGVAEDRAYYFEAQHMAHLCKEELPFESRARLAEGAKGDPVAEVLVPSLSRLFDICAGVDVGSARASENQPVRSDLPTLLIGAEIDPGCPPPLTLKAAEGYTNGQVVIVTNATHGVVVNNRCAARMARDFLRNPSGTLDRTCLPAADAPLAFIESPAA